MVGVALSVFVTGATDAEMYFRIQTEKGVDAGVSAEVMRDYDGMMADYLAGDEAALDDAALFGDQEIAHMRDVYALFAAARGVRIVALAAGLLLLFLSAFRRARWRRAFAVGGAVGMALFLLPLGAIGVWALVDFHGAFRAMHEHIFANMLWLLDPGSFMIRMLPEPFFSALAGRLMWTGGLSALAVPAMMIGAEVFSGRRFFDGLRRACARKNG
jgi:integral membrane protein (TIGR01906 family)